MAIRIRVVDGVMVALCAARSVPKEGDVYLDDAMHYALSTKFALDFNSNRLWEGGELPYEPREAELIEQEESNNENRSEWDEWMQRSLL